jgi:hypothetical protein
MYEYSILTNTGNVAQGSSNQETELNLKIFSYFISFIIFVFLFS